LYIVHCIARSHECRSDCACDVSKCLHARKHKHCTSTTTTTPLYIVYNPLLCSHCLVVEATSQLCRRTNQKPKPHTQHYSTVTSTKFYSRSTTRTPQQHISTTAGCVIDDCYCHNYCYYCCCCCRLWSCLCSLL
jgi:hypothetical protein